MRIPSVVVANLPGLVTAALGLAWGWSLVSPSRGGRWQVAGRLAITPVAMLGVAGVGYALTQRARPGRMRLACVAVIAYQGAILLNEPFHLSASPGYRCACGLVILAPLFLILSVLARGRAWWAVCGIALFSIASIALLIDNGMADPRDRSGSGFFAPARTR